LKQFVRLVERVIPSETGKQTKLLSLAMMDTKASNQGMMLEAVDADIQMYRALVMEFVSSLVYAKFTDMETMQQRYSYLKNMGENILSALHHGNVDVRSPEIVSRAELLGNLAHGTKLFKDLWNDFLRFSKDKEASIQSYWDYFKTHREQFQKSSDQEKNQLVHGMHDDDEEILQSFVQGKQSLGNESLVSIVTMQRQVVLGLEALS
jgi:hypothetical protein